MDGLVRMETYIRLLKQKGFGGMLVADHNSYDGYRKWESSVCGKAHQDFVVLKGVEYDTADCGHMLVVMPEDMKLQILEMRGLPLSLLVKIVHRFGGIIGPAHPFGERYLSMATTLLCRKKPLSIMKQFDFVEIFNSCEDEKDNDAARKLAEKYQKPGIGGSDAHREDNIGMAYTELPKWIQKESDLISYIKSAPRIMCGGTYYKKRTKDKLGKWNTLLVGLFFFYNKAGTMIKLSGRRKELKKLFDINRVKSYNR